MPEIFLGRLQVDFSCYQNNVILFHNEELCLARGLLSGQVNFLDYSIGLSGVHVCRSRLTEWRHVWIYDGLSIYSLLHLLTACLNLKLLCRSPDFYDMSTYQLNICNLSSSEILNCRNLNFGIVYTMVAGRYQ